MCMILKWQALLHKQCYRFIYPLEQLLQANFPFPSLMGTSVSLCQCLAGMQLLLGVCCYCRHKCVVRDFVLLTIYGKAMSFPELHLGAEALVIMPDIVDLYSFLFASDCAQCLIDFILVCVHRVCWPIWA